MKDLISSFSGPWLIIGDLNSICSNVDKKGGRLGGSSDSNRLNDFVANSGAIDLGFYGPQFTWSNKREGLANIKERLDRGLCDPEWQRIFPKVGVRHLGALTSDHRPILLDTYIDNCKLNRPFQFEAMWTKDESSVEVIERAWDINVEGSQSFKLAKKIKRVADDLKSWNKNHFGYAKTRIKELEKLIKEVRGRDPTKENLEIEASIMFRA
jgi:hypothetical protein